MTSKEDFLKIFPDDNQIGGTHYKQFNIQPWTFIKKINYLTFKGM